MDTTILIADVKARFSHNSAKEILKDKYNSKLIVAEQGGLWTASPTLMTFLATSVTASLVVIDNFGNPVKVDRVNLLTKLRDTYNSVMNEWYEEWSELEKKR